MQNVDITGIRRGRLVAKAAVPRAEWPRYPRGDSFRLAAIWILQCDCGRTTQSRKDTFLRGSKASCGCIQESKRRVQIVGGNGNSKTPAYKSWLAMIHRCFYPATNRYNQYGGRGITVCERWLRFEDFLSDMGSRPEGTSIDRLNSNGNYEPSNCRWATQREQRKNQRPRTHCLSGHPYSAASSKSKKMCRACYEYARLRRQAMRTAAVS